MIQISLATKTEELRKKESPESMIVKGQESACAALYGFSYGYSRSWGNGATSCSHAHATCM